MIYLPIETSGEGEINAHSRVQMALGEAKFKAKDEFARVLNETGFTLESIREYVAEHPELKQPFYHVPHAADLIGVGASFIRHVAERMRQDGRRPSPASPVESVEAVAEFAGAAS
jgi:hypothetical protein